MLARMKGVDDGLLVQASHIPQLDLIELTLRCGDLQMGYFDLELTYRGAEISDEDEQTLARIARATKVINYESDLYCFEIDLLPDGRIEHRFLFHPGIWFLYDAEN